MGDERVKKQNVTNGRNQTSMKAGVVAPEASMAVDTKNSGGDLRGKEQGDGKIKWGTGNLKLFFLKTSDGPTGADDNRHSIDKHHLVEFENFGGKGPKQKGSDEEKGVETDLNKGVGRGDFWILRDARGEWGNWLLIFVLAGHVDSLPERCGSKKGKLRGFKPGVYFRKSPVQRT